MAKLPDHQFRMVGSAKVSWILIVVLAGIIGAFVWQFASVARFWPRPAAPPG